MVTAIMLPFVRWPDAPRDDEPVHGFYLRLVEAQGEVSLQTFNIWNDFSSESIDTARMLSTIELHPMPQEWKDRLRWNSPIPDGDRYTLRGHRFPRHHFHFGTRRWCPGCIADHPHHRSWWELESIRRCPIHLMDFETRDADGAPVTWVWPEFARSRRGHYLGRRAEPACPNSTFARYLLGRLGWLEPTPAPLLDDVDLPGVIDFCEYVGRFLQNPPVKKHPKIVTDTADIGFRALAGSKGDLAESFRTWLRTFKRKCINGVIPSFAWAYPKLAFMPDSCLKPIVPAHSTRRSSSKSRSRRAR